MEHKTAEMHIEVKAFDEEQRVIMGMATTGTMDRVGDIVEPMGVRSEKEIPLLLNHDRKQIVGTVRLGAPTKSGVPFTATIPKVTELGLLRDRVDEAWQMVKYKLLRKVSIGFKPIGEKFEQLKEGGWRFLESEVVELSLVPVPANAQAEILSFKSASGAASGHSAVRLNSPLPGASGQHQSDAKGNTVKTIQERIAGWEAKRLANDAARKELEDRADDEERTLTEEEKTVHGQLTADIKDVDAHLKLLREREAEIKLEAKAVTIEDGTDPDRATTARNGGTPHVLMLKDKMEPGVEFARYVKLHLAADGNEDKALKLARQMYPNAERLHSVMKAEAERGMMIAKTDVAGGITSHTTWGGALVQYQDLLSVFLDWLRPQTIIGQFGTGNIPSLTKVDFLSRVRVQTSGGAGYWVGEGKPKPVTKFDFSNITMAITKVANIAVLSEEEIRFSTPAADAKVRDALAAALIELLDRDFIDPDFAGSANVSPASITYGAPTSTASGTTNPTAVADTGTAVEALLANFPQATMGGLVWLMSGRTAYKLSQAYNALGQFAFPGIGISGGSWGGIPVITSEYLAYGGGLSPASNNLLILVHAPSIFLADDGGVRIDSSNEASLEMMDNPTNNITTPTHTSMVSMYQTNSVAIRAERMINWKRAREGSVYVLTNVAYSGLAS